LQRCQLNLLVLLVLCITMMFHFTTTTADDGSCIRYPSTVRCIPGCLIGDCCMCCRPNMVTNMGVPTCAAVAAQNVYVNGVTYAIQKLGRLPNVGLYLDIGHSGCAPLSPAVTTC
jgi:Glycosyl hydrolases family 6